MRTTFFWNYVIRYAHNNLHQVRSKKNSLESNNSKVFGTKKTKKHKYIDRNQLRSPMAEGGEP